MIEADDNIQERDRESMNNTTKPTNWPDPAATGASVSILAHDLSIEGDLDSKGPVEVHGKVSGDVRAPQILIAASATVDGAAIALDLSVLGAMSGSIDAHQVSLAPGSVVKANITHERIAIEAGAQFEGQLKRKI